MLKSLYDLARREGLLEDPDYEKKRVDYLIVIDTDGDYFGLLPTVGDDDMAMECSVPRFPKRSGSGTSPGFLFDNAKYVLGHSTVKKEGDADRNKRCMESFRARIGVLAKETNDEGAVAVCNFYDRISEYLPRIINDHPDKMFSGTEWITFELNDELVINREAVRKYWSLQRGLVDADGLSTDGLSTDGLSSMRCLVTGSLCSPASTHGNIKGVPKTQTSGAALVSFNARSFESHGLKQGSNAPISRAAAEGYVTGLNWLLQETSGRGFRYGVGIGDSVTVFWTKQKHGFVDEFINLLDPPVTAEQAMNVAESPLIGLATSSIDSTAFYAVTLGGNSSRVVVRDYIETTVKDIKENISKWFCDLNIVGSNKPLPICQLIESAKAPSGRGLSPSISSQLLKTAVYGGQFPRELLSSVLRRMSLPPDKNNESQHLVARHLVARHLVARCALIKAMLIRSTNKHMEVSVSLDENNTSVSYLLGRLFAVLERQQSVALENVNATIRDRYFGSASCTPAIVFPRLISLSMHHASKSGGRGIWIDIIKSKIMAALPAGPLPSILSLEDRGLFAIGYYHQRAKFFEKKEVVSVDSNVVDNESQQEQEQE